MYIYKGTASLTAIAEKIIHHRMNGKIENNIFLYERARSKIMLYRKIKITARKNVLVIKEKRAALKKKRRNQYYKSSQSCGPSIKGNPSQRTYGDRDFSTERGQV